MDVEGLPTELMIEGAPFRVVYRNDIPLGTAYIIPIDPPPRSNLIDWLRSIITLRLPGEPKASARVSSVE